MVVVGAAARTSLLRQQAWGAGALAAGALVFVVAALSWPLVSRSAACDPSVVPLSPEALPGADITVPDERHKRVVPAILAAAPLTTVGVALVRASIPSIIDSNSSGRLVLWTIPAFSLAVVGFVLARAIVPWAFRGTENEAARKKLFVFVEVVVVVVCAAVYILAIDDPWKWAPRFGVPAIIATFMAALVVVFGTLGHWMESRKLPAALDVVGFRRLPVIFGLIVLGILSHHFAGDGYHDVKTMGEATMPANPQLTVEAAFDRWTSANLGGASVVDKPPAEQQAEPLVFVAAAGGGIKAAAFTSAALDCMFVGANAATEPCASTPAWSTVFAASGASGGSVGIASVMAQQQLDSRRCRQRGRLGQRSLRHGSALAGTRLATARRGAERDHQLQPRVWTAVRCCRNRGGASSRSTSSSREAARSTRTPPDEDGRNRSCSSAGRISTMGVESTSPRLGRRSGCRRTPREPVSARTNACSATVRRRTRRVPATWSTTCAAATSIWPRPRFSPLGSRWCRLREPSTVTTGT